MSAGNAITSGVTIDVRKFSGNLTICSLTGFSGDSTGELGGMALLESKSSTAGISLISGFAFRFKSNFGDREMCSTGGLGDSVSGIVMEPACDTCLVSTYKLEGASGSFDSLDE